MFPAERAIQEQHALQRARSEIAAMSAHDRERCIALLCKHTIETQLKARAEQLQQQKEQQLNQERAMTSPVQEHPGLTDEHGQQTTFYS